jgi:hypothetical protein
MPLFSKIFKRDSNTQISFSSPSTSTIQGNEGGMSIVGGTQSGDDLNLSSTNHATKGTISIGSSVYDEVNDRLGINTAVPVTGFDSRGDITSVTWADGFARNTASYFRNDFDQNVPAVLSGLFGVDMNFSPTSNSALNINGAFYSLTIAGSFSNTAGIASKSMQAQTVLTGSGTHSIQLIGMEGRISTTAASTASLTNANTAAINGLLNIVGTNNITSASSYIATAAFPNLTASATNIYGFRVLNPSKGASYTVANYGGFVLEDNTMTVSTTKIGFYQKGTNYHNRLVGNVRVGADSTPVDTLDVTGSIGATTSIKSSGATSGIGYATGAGGTVTQSTSKATAVTLNKVCGKIQTAADALNTGIEVTFVVTNTSISINDCVVVNHASGGTLGAYGVFANTILSSACSITITNLSGGSLSEALTLNFAVIKGVAS